MIVLAANYWYLQTDWLPIWINAVLAFVGIVAAIIALRTLSALKKQILAMCDAERAWILVKRVGNPEKNWYSPNEPQYIPGMVFEFKVNGKTPARITDSRFFLGLVRTRIGIVPAEPDLPPVPDYDSRRRPSRSEVSEAGRVLAPEDTFRIELNIPQVTEEESSELIDGRAVMCAYGIIKYRDAFNIDRETRTCYLYNYAGGGVLIRPDGTVVHPPGFYMGSPPEYNKET